MKIKSLKILAKITGRLVIGLFTLIVVYGCSTASIPETPPPSTDLQPTHEPTDEAAILDPSPTRMTSKVDPTETSSFQLALTHQQPDGNRVVAGSGNMPVEPRDIPLNGRPVWLVGAVAGGQTIWVVVLESGEVQGFTIVGDDVTRIEFGLTDLPPGKPPIAQVADDRLELLPPFEDESDTTHQFPLSGDLQVYIDKRRSVRIVRNGAASYLGVQALPDARILSDGIHRILFLSGPSDQYPHGVLGDDLEATTVIMVDLDGDTISIREIQIDESEVIEGVSPMWVDMDGDGIREIIVTQSSSAAGSRLVVYRENGSIFANGEPIGLGNRWLHQLAVGQFIPGGPLEIAAIRTPHIGGVLQLYSLTGDRLKISASLGHYSTHHIGSRNLDSAVAGDFNGDGVLEIVVPNQAHTTLNGIQWMDSELQVVWEVPLGGEITTNLAAVTSPDGYLALGAGISNNQLRIWIPEE